MKRKGEPAKGPQTGKKQRSTTAVGKIAPSDPFSRSSPYEIGDKIIGFYGGWPYPGIVQKTAEVRMSFGLTHTLFVRWHGFSGKTATGWLSEFDMVPNDSTGQAIKDRMEVLRREKMKSLDKIAQKRVFLQIVREVRGNRLAPLQPITAPYPDEWQTIIRLTAVPKPLIDHLVGSECLIYERRLTLGMKSDNTYLETACISGVLKDWAKESEVNLNYAHAILEMFNCHLFKVLLYKFELPFITKRLIDTQVIDFSTILPIEFILRLLNIMPQLVTAACARHFNSNGEFVTEMLTFANSHQEFMGYLVKNTDSLLIEPRTACTVHDACPEDYFSGVFQMDLATFKLFMDTKQVGGGVEDHIPRKLPPKHLKPVWKSKRKNSRPMFCAPAGHSYPS